jgi:retinol dehydrogenase-12
MELSTELILGISIGVIPLLLWLFRRWMQGPLCTSTARLDGQTAVITGANAGIGKITARDLCRRGARVLLLCRSRDRGEAAAAEIRAALAAHRDCGEVLVDQLDLSSLASVRACAESLLSRLDRVHILVNNAGVMACPRTLTPEGFELQLATNHLGHFLLTHLLLPLLKRAAAEPNGSARVVTVSSLAHKRGRIHWEDVNFERSRYRPFEAYGQSKLANLLFSAELARRLAGTRVTTYALHPGVIRSDLWRNTKQTFGVVIDLAFNCLVRLV